MSTETLQAATGIDTATITLPYLTLRDLFAGALVAASSDMIFPTLCAVLIEWDADGLTAVATDRYRMAWGTYTFPEGHDRPATAGSVLLSRDFVAAAVKALPRTYKGPAVQGGLAPFESATLTVAGDTATVAWCSAMSEGAMSTAVMVGTFPKWRPLTAGDAADTESIAFNPAFLADAAKLPHVKNAPILWTLRGSTRPATGRYAEPVNGVSWSYLLMPIRPKS